MSSQIKRARHPLFMFALMLCMGSILVINSRDAVGRSEHLQTVPLVGTAALADSQPGRDVFVVGIVSPRNTAAHADLIAFVRERGVERRETHTPHPTGRSGSLDRPTPDGSPQPNYQVGGIDWEQETVVSPPLLLDTDSGPIQIEAPGGGDGYSLRAPVRIEDREALQRFRGIKSREQVTVLGVVSFAREQVYVDAATVFAGTREEYVGGLNEEAQMMWFTGLGLIGVGLVGLLSTCVWAFLNTDRSA